MRRAALASMTVCALLLAGCGADPSADDGPDPRASSSSGTTAPPLPPPVLRTYAVGFNGTLGTFAHGCVFPAGLCHTQRIQDEDTSQIVVRDGTNLTALVLDATWTARSPATAQLVLGAFISPACEECDPTLLDEVQGPSPLHLEVAGLMHPLTDQARLHLYFYNPQGVVAPPGGAGYAVVSADEDVVVAGALTVLTPP